jgi:hypothetical protein
MGHPLTKPDLRVTLPLIATDPWTSPHVAKAPNGASWTWVGTRKFRLDAGKDAGDHPGWRTDSDALPAMVSGSPLGDDAAVLTAQVPDHDHPA